MRPSRGRVIRRARRIPAVLIIDAGAANRFDAERRTVVRALSSDNHRCIDRVGSLVAASVT
jgi:hypothetical protein